MGFESCLLCVSEFAIPGPSKSFKAWLVLKRVIFNVIWKLVSAQSPSVGCGLQMLHTACPLGVYFSIREREHVLRRCIPPRRPGISIT